MDIFKAPVAVDMARHNIDLDGMVRMILRKMKYMGV